MRRIYTLSGKELGVKGTSGDPTADQRATYRQPMLVVSREWAPMSDQLVERLKGQPEIQVILDRRELAGAGSKEARNDRGSILMIAMFIMLVLSLLGSALLSLSSIEHNMAYNGLWAEGAFSAAEAGIQTGLNQLSPNPAGATQAIPVTAIGTGIYTYQFRSGQGTDAGPQPLVFRGSRIEKGYNIAVGTGYNPSGYAFHSYQIDATGTGPRSAMRELEVLAEYGPVAQ